MGLTTTLRRLTPLRPLIVTAPGGEPARMAVERWCDRRTWSPAYAPAQANALVVCGPGSAALDAAADEVWRQLPLPRRRVTVRTADDVDAALHHTLTALRSPSYPTDDAPEPGAAGHRNAEPSEHERHDHHHQPEQAGHGGHGGHGQMVMPGGVAMAGRGTDRDGLMLDRLHVTLGPALYPWPAGLVVRLVLQGDVVQEAAAELLSGGPRLSIAPAVRLLDQAQSLLVLAGWPGAARDARRLRDAVRTGTPPTGYRRWATRVRRSRMLRWSLSGLGRLPADRPTPIGGPETGTRATPIDGTEQRRRARPIGRTRPRTAAGPRDATEPATDVYRRLSAWLDGLDVVLAGHPVELVEPDPGLLPAALAGGDLAAARLVVASLGAAPVGELVPERA
jgi:hypothetical protein